MFDVIVVGARCAGSPTAMLLARKGHRVLVLDRAQFPSDILSTHFVQPQGIAQLERWGLLERLRATGCPPIARVTMTLDGAEMPSPPADPTLPPAYCPRRTVLDKLLVDAAREAGAEIREGVSVREVLFEGGRVVGVRARARGGSEFSERARVVVGADGTHSLVARSVRAEAYEERPSLTCGYYTYWTGVPMDGAEIAMANGSGMLAFPTNDDAVCVAVGRRHSDFHLYRSDIEGHYMRFLEAASPSMAERVRAGRRVERWMGTADVPNFFRKPYGPGWALVGDAGYHKDPVTGLGIMDAWRDAELLADALDAGLTGREPLEEALAGYQRARDEAALPMYRLTTALAEFPSPEELLQDIAQQPAAAQAG